MTDKFEQKDWSGKTWALRQALDHGGKAIDELRLTIDSLNTQQLDPSAPEVVWVAAERLEARLEDAFNESLQADNAAWRGKHELADLFMEAK